MRSLIRSPTGSPSVRRKAWPSSSSYFARAHRSASARSVVAMVKREYFPLMHTRQRQPRPRRSKWPGAFLFRAMGTPLPLAEERAEGFLDQGLDGGAALGRGDLELPREPDRHPHTDQHALKGTCHTGLQGGVGMLTS